MSSNDNLTRGSKNDSISLLIEPNNETPDTSRSTGRTTFIVAVTLAAIVMIITIALAVSIVQLNDKVNSIERTSLMDNSGQQVSETASGYGKVHEEIHTNGFHLTGINPFLSIYQDSEDGMEKIRNWQDKSGSGANGMLRLFNGTEIIVEEDGFYRFYGQITWRKLHGMAVFGISMAGGEATLETPFATLARCTDSFNGKYAVMKSCYTSATATLHRGDRVWIDVVKDDFSMDFGNGRSFFGAVRLDNADSEDFT